MKDTASSPKTEQTPSNNPLLECDLFLQYKELEFFDNTKKGSFYQWGIVDAKDCPA